MLNWFNLKVLCLHLCFILILLVICTYVFCYIGNTFLMANICIIYAFFILGRKAHRNGIKKPKAYRHESNRGVSTFEYSN